mgnify:CR=1 FL=1
MNIDGKPYRTIWLGSDGVSAEIIDQTKLPFALEIVTLRTLDEAARAIASRCSSLCSPMRLSSMRRRAWRPMRSAGLCSARPEHSTRNSTGRRARCASRRRFRRWRSRARYIDLSCERAT